MSWREHKDPAQERTHEREIDRTGNGIVNHGPENAPNVNSDGHPDTDAVSVEGVPETEGGGDDRAETERLAGLTALFGAVSGVGPGAGSGRGPVAAPVVSVVPATSTTPVRTWTRSPCAVCCGALSRASNPVTAPSTI